ncbi:hypothetical protein MSAN_01173400 [Mycena sanguinolenta]|uniref:Uncharacterized protein n=1 Tax=Mycena sanguinolenta TaxID=230812 RepID=A0A8H6YK81_9AGAR|nr:hypothetical protein MSAN_01173400 [Mycena sanguinolenta]
MSPSARWKAPALEDLPTWILPNPFEPYAEGQYGADEWGPRPLTIFDLTMCELSWTLRSKPDWQSKAADPEILSKWRQEALEQAAAQDPSTEVPLTEKMIDYVLAELDSFAFVADNERGIERACFNAIWYSDRLISSDVLERLETAVKTLEDIPEEKKDWHPGTNKQVLDLVHPSLYCVVYDRTHAYLPNKPRVAANFLPVRAPESNSEFTSKVFSWIPSDFTVDDEGVVRLVSPYINNLHPVLHQAMYPVIEEVLTAFIPLFERVLGDVNRENNRNAFPDNQRFETIECIWGPDGKPYPEEEPGSDEDEDEFNEKFWAKVEKVLPEPREYNGDLELRFSPVFAPRKDHPVYRQVGQHPSHARAARVCGRELARRSLPCIGMANERIVASGIYYYDEENITESRLAFRVAVGEPEYHGQDDSECMKMLYDMNRDCDLLQELGSVVTKAGRTLSWPNLFQHCVSPFKLADPSKPGHRKILAIFLVDPTKDRIVSTTDVPPQQADWAGVAFDEACKEPSSKLGVLPQELRDLVKDNFPPTVMTLKEAEAYRLKLMKERTASVVEHAKEYVQTFNMCEH